MNNINVAFGLFDFKTLTTELIPLEILKEMRNFLNVSFYIVLINYLADKQIDRSNERMGCCVLSIAFGSR